MDKNNVTFSRRDFYFVVFKYKKQIVLFCTFAIIIIIAGLYVWPETYAARAKLLIKLGRENVFVSTTPPSAQQNVLNAGLRKEDINSEIRILSSRFIIEKMVEKLGTDFLYPKRPEPDTLFKKIKHYLMQSIINIKDFIFEILYKINFKKKLSVYERTVMEVGKKLSVTNVRDSDVIEIQLRWSSPRIAVNMLNVLIDYYLLHHLEIHKMSGGSDFLEKQVEVLGGNLKASEERLEKLKEIEEIDSYKEQRNLILQNVSRYKSLFKDTQTTLLETTMKIDGLKEQMASIMKAVSPGFETAYKEAEKELLMERVHLKSLEGKRQMLKQHIKMYNADLDRLNKNEFKLKRFNRQILLDEKNYLLYKEKLEEARISDVLDTERISNVKIIDFASASSIPVSPKKMLILSLGVLLSLIVGISFPFLLNYCDHSVRSAEDVNRYLDLPLLASIEEKQ